MSSKLDCIVLIDDDQATNFMNRLILKKAGFEGEIKIFQSGSKGLEYLKHDKDPEFIKPDIIFLDINMPGMNGWEFLEEYKKLDQAQRSRIVVVMLTTSLNPEDEEKGRAIPEVNEFCHKPLAPSVFQNIVHKYFNNHES